MIFNKYIDEYIELVEKNKIITNEDIKKSIKLVKEKLSDSRVIIDHEKIEKAISKMEEYFPFKLLPWEKFIVGLIHCYYEDDTLVFDTFFLYMGRGAGKNGFISAISWYLTTGFHGIKEYNIDIVANSEDQAKTSFEDVYNQEYIDMQTNVQLYTEFMTKRMNIPEGNKDKEVTSWENILATNQEIPNLKGATCRVGIDYAKTTDFVCAGLLFKYAEKYIWLSHTWVCKSSKDLKRIKAPLEEWEKQGLLTFIDKAEVHPDIPAEWLAKQASKYNLTILGMDNFRYTLLAKSLRAVGFDTDKKGTNNIKLTRPSDQMKIYPIINSAFTNKNIIFGDNPLMRWYTNNTCLHPEKYDNYTFSKIEPKSRKTDGFMAFVASMCTDIDNLPDSALVVDYEDFGVYTY